MIIRCHTQADPDWWEAKCGIPSASNFSRIFRPSTGTLSKQADAYVKELVADRLCQLPKFFSERGQVPRKFTGTSPEMERGVELEPLARKWYSKERRVPVWRTGFVTTDCGRFGCSPDGLIGLDGGLEIKCYDEEKHRRWVKAGTLPATFAAQVHGSLIVTGREWWDLVLFHHEADEPKAIIRVVPDDMTRDLRVCLEQFDARYSEALKKAGLTRETA